jgi:hypothetical protein
MKPPEPLPQAKFNPYRNAGKQPAPPLSEEQKEYVLGKPVPLSELNSDQCQWPIGEREGWDEHLFCGQKVADLCDGKPTDSIRYCPHHCRMAWVPASGMRRKVYARASGTPSERRATEAA